MNLLEKIKNIFRKEKTVEMETVLGDKYLIPEKQANQLRRKGVLDDNYRQIPIRFHFPQQKAIHSDYGKFFKGKGKHHHKTYRKSVRAKINPEEEEEKKHGS